MKLQRKEGLVTPLLFLVSAFILLLASLQYYWPGKWWSNAEALGWNGEALALVKGQGHGGQGRLTIEGVDKSGVAHVSLSPTAFRAEDYPVVRWSILGARPKAKVEFMWRTAPNRVFARQLEWEGNSVAPLRMAEDTNWRGEVRELMLMVHPPLDEPLIIEAVKLEPFSPLGTLWREWFGAEPWLGTSINFVGGNIDRQWLAPLPFVTVALGLALLVYWLLVWRKVLAPDVRMLWALVFIAWFALDMRWQFDLWHKLGLTQQRYAGKSWEAKHLAARDGSLFDLMQQIKTRLPSTTSRVFLFADDEYMRMRGAYHLYPFNVFSGRDLLPAGKFRSGDFIIILGKDEVGFDTPHNLLTWEPKQRLTADLLLLAANNVLLKVR